MTASEIIVSVIECGSLGGVLRRRMIRRSLRDKLRDSGWNSSQAASKSTVEGSKRRAGYPRERKGRRQIWLARRHGTTTFAVHLNLLKLVPPTHRTLDYHA